MEQMNKPLLLIKHKSNDSFIKKDAQGKLYQTTNRKSSQIKILDNNIANTTNPEDKEKNTQINKRSNLTSNYNLKNSDKQAKIGNLNKVFLIDFNTDNKATKEFQVTQYSNKNQIPVTAREKESYTANRILKMTKSVIKNSRKFKKYLTNYNNCTKVNTFKTPENKNYPIYKNLEFVSLRTLNQSQFNNEASVVQVSTDPSISYNLNYSSVNLNTTKRDVNDSYSMINNTNSLFNKIKEKYNKLYNNFFYSSNFNSNPDNTITNCYNTTQTEVVEGFQSMNFNNLNKINDSNFNSTFKDKKFPEINTDIISEISYSQMNTHFSATSKMQLNQLHNILREKNNYYKDNNNKDYSKDNDMNKSQVEIVSPKHLKANSLYEDFYSNEIVKSPKKRPYDIDETTAYLNTSLPITFFISFVDLKGVYKNVINKPKYSNDRSDYKNIISPVIKNDNEKEKSNYFNFNFNFNANSNIFSSNRLETDVSKHKKNQNSAFSGFSKLSHLEKDYNKDRDNRSFANTEYTFPKYNLNCDYNKNTFKDWDYIGYLEEQYNEISTNSIENFDSNFSSTFPLINNINFNKHKNNNNSMDINLSKLLEKNKFNNLNKKIDEENTVNNLRLSINSLEMTIIDDNKNVIMTQLLPFKLLPIFYKIPENDFFTILSQLFNETNMSINESIEEGEDVKKPYPSSNKKDFNFTLNWNNFLLALHLIYKPSKSFKTKKTFFPNDSSKKKFVKFNQDSNDDSSYHISSIYYSHNKFCIDFIDNTTRYLITLETPKVIVELKNRCIVKYLKPEIILFLMNKSFVNWEFYVLNYLAELKSFRTAFTETFSYKCNYSNYNSEYISNGFRKNYTNLNNYNSNINSNITSKKNYTIVDPNDTMSSDYNRSINTENNNNIDIYNEARVKFSNNTEEINVNNKSLSPVFFSNTKFKEKQGQKSKFNLSDKEAEKNTFNSHFFKSNTTLINLDLISTKYISYDDLSYKFIVSGNQGIVFEKINPLVIVVEKEDKLRELVTTREFHFNLSHIKKIEDIKNHYKLEEYFKKFFKLSFENNEKNQKEKIEKTEKSDKRIRKYTSMTVKESPTVKLQNSPHNTNTNTITSIKGSVNANSINNNSNVNYVYSPQTYVSNLKSSLMKPENRNKNQENEADIRNIKNTQIIEETDKTDTDKFTTNSEKDVQNYRKNSSKKIDNIKNLRIEENEESDKETVKNNLIFEINENSELKSSNSDFEESMTEEEGKLIESKEKNGKFSKKEESSFSNALKLKPNISSSNKDKENNITNNNIRDLNRKATNNLTKAVSSTGSSKNLYTFNPNNYNQSYTIKKGNKKAIENPVKDVKQAVKQIPIFTSITSNIRKIQPELLFNYEYFNKVNTGLFEFFPTTTINEKRMGSTKIITRCKNQSTNSIKKINIEDEYFLSETKIIPSTITMNANHLNMLIDIKDHISFKIKELRRTYITRFCLTSNGELKKESVGSLDKIIVQDFSKLPPNKWYTVVIKYINFFKRNIKENNQASSYKKTIQLKNASSTLKVQNSQVENYNKRISKLMELGILSNNQLNQINQHNQFNNNNTSVLRAANKQGSNKIFHHNSQMLVTNHSHISNNSNHNANNNKSVHSNDCGINNTNTNNSHGNSQLINLFKKDKSEFKLDHIRKASICVSNSTFLTKNNNKSINFNDDNTKVKASKLTKNNLNINLSNANTNHYTTNNKDKESSENMTDKNKGNKFSSNDNLNIVNLNHTQIPGIFTVNSNKRELSNVSKFGMNKESSTDVKLGDSLNKPSPVNLDMEKIKAKAKNLKDLSAL